MTMLEMQVPVCLSTVASHGAAAVAAAEMSTQTDSQTQATIIGRDKRLKHVAQQHKMHRTYLQLRLARGTAHLRSVVSVRLFCSIF